MYIVRGENTNSHVLSVCVLNVDPKNLLPIGAESPEPHDSVISYFPLDWLVMLALSQTVWQLSNFLAWRQHQTLQEEQGGEIVLSSLANVNLKMNEVDYILKHKFESLKLDNKLEIKYLFPTSNGVLW